MSTPADAKKLVEEAISAHPVVVFSKTSCPFCTAAKSALATAGGGVTDYPGARVLELDGMGALGAAVQKYIAEKTGRRTVPSVFVGGRPVGGGDEMHEAMADGRLAGMLAAAVAGARAGVVPAGEGGEKPETTSRVSSK